MRVEIPAYTDRWIMGDRCGEVVGYARGRTTDGSEIVKVKLDRSGAVVRVALDDCSVIWPTTLT